MTILLFYQDLVPTDGSVSMQAATVQWSADSSDWNDIQNTVASIALDGGNRMIGDKYTSDGDTAIIGAGKREPIDVEVNLVYSEVTTESFMALEPYYTAGTPLRIRWLPAGSTTRLSWFASGSSTGNYRYTTATGYLSAMVYPAGDIDPGEPIICSLTVRAMAIEKETV